MLCFSALVAGSFALGGMTANLVPPAAINALRFLLATVLIGSVLAATGKLDRAGFRAPWRYLIVGGLFAIYFVLMFEGLKTAPPVSAAAVFTLMPVMSAGAGWVLLRQITTPRMAVALAIGGTGAVWVIFKADLSALLAFEVGRGEAIYFVGCIAHAFFTPMMRRLNRGESAPLFAFGSITACAGILTVYGASDLLAVDWAALPGIFWITVVYLAVAATALSFVCVQYATLRLPSAKVMAYSYLTPAWVILWEIALGHGGPTSLVLIGIALACVALLLLLKDQERLPVSSA